MKRARPLLWLGWLVGCSGPEIDGPQIRGLTGGFAFDPNCRVARSEILDERPGPQRCFIKGWNKDTPDCIVTISEFPGGIDRDDVAATHQDFVARYQRCDEQQYCIEYSEISECEVAGRRGWYYFELTRIADKQLSRVLHATIPWDEITTYTISIDGNADQYRSENWLRHALTGFEVHDARELLPIQAGVGLLVVILAYFAYQKIQSMRPDDPTQARQRVQARTFVAPSSLAPQAATVRKPPLLDAGPRVEALLRKLPVAPAPTLAELEALREGYAPNQHVLHALILGYAQTGNHAGAIASASEAFPVFFQRGCYAMACEAWRALGPRSAARVGLTPSERLLIAESMLEQGDWQSSQPLFESLVRDADNDERAVTGLQRLAERHLEAAGLSDEAMRVYQFVLQRIAADSALATRTRLALERVKPFARESS
jgi:hypothetical protein